jgi:hypothetical protein
MEFNPSRFIDEQGKLKEAKELMPFSVGSFKSNSNDLVLDGQTSMLRRGISANGVVLVPR